MDLPSLSPTVQSLKAQGNESYKKGDFNEANLLYSRAIELATGSSRSELVLVGMDTVEGLFDLLSNRTAALIQIGDFGRGTLALLYHVTRVTHNPVLQLCWMLMLVLD